MLPLKKEGTTLNTGDTEISLPWINRLRTEDSLSMSGAKEKF